MEMVAMSLAPCHFDSAGDSRDLKIMPVASFPITVFSSGGQGSAGFRDGMG